MAKPHSIPLSCCQQIHIHGYVRGRNLRILLTLCGSRSSVQFIKLTQLFNSMCICVSVHLCMWVHSLFIVKTIFQKFLGNYKQGYIQPHISHISLTIIIINLPYKVFLLLLFKSIVHITLIFNGSRKQNMK